MDFDSKNVANRKLFYNSSMGGVDTVDKYKATYTKARMSNSWSMRVFYSMLDIVRVNSFIVLKENVNKQDII